MSTAPHDLRERASRYLVAVLTTAAAVIATRAIQPLVSPGVTPFFLLAVAITALYGGRAAGAIAALLSAAALGYWFFPPYASFAVESRADLTRLLIFAGVALAIAWIAGTARAQRWRAVREARENVHLRHAAEAAAVEAEKAARQAAGALAGQQHAETALRQSESELADFFETASIGLHWVAEDGTVLRVNQAELDLLGYERDEYVGRHIADFHVDERVIADMLCRLAEGEALRQYPARLRCKDGQIKDVVIDSSAYFKDGRFVHTRCFTRDVTAEKRAQDAVARLAAIVASSSDAIVGKTLEGVITSWNAAAERIFGYTAAEMVGASVYRLIPPELHAAERDLLERVRRGEAVEFSEAERIRKDGGRIWISLSVSPVRDERGAITGAASIKRDVTERRMLEERLRDTQRLQAVGQLAGGIAHEANNQMAVVLGGAHFLLKRSDLPEAARQDIEQIRQAGERTAAITQQLLAFSRRQVLQPQDVDLNEVVQSIGPVLRRSLAESQSLEVRLGPLGGPVRADPRQLEQVLLNLTLNARDAMPAGGTLTIETRELTVSGADSRDNGPPPGRYEVLIVRDTGHGMDAITLDRVFEPFFTTKAVGQGTGLGLSVVHGIVNQTGGHIRVDTAPGEGAAFELYFPLAPGGRAADIPPVDEQPAPPAEGTVVLVVEDDAPVRGIAVRALREAGYDTLEAEHGRAALDLVRAHVGRLDLVVTDLGMPVMDGHQLARCLHEERPGVPVLFMTGYGDQAPRDRFSADRGHAVLRKPFSPDALVRAAREVLASQPR